MKDLNIGEVVWDDPGLRLGRLSVASATLYVCNRCRRGRVGFAKFATLRGCTSSATPPRPARCEASGTRDRRG
jgi:hypothetical protein